MKFMFILPMKFIKLLLNSDNDIVEQDMDSRQRREEETKAQTKKKDKHRRCKEVLRVEEICRGRRAGGLVNRQKVKEGVRGGTRMMWRDVWSAHRLAGWVHPVMDTFVCAGWRKTTASARECVCRAAFSTPITWISADESRWSPHAQPPLERYFRF